MNKVLKDTSEFILCLFCVISIILSSTWILDKLLKLYRIRFNKSIEKIREIKYSNVDMISDESDIELESISLSDNQIL